MTDPKVKESWNSRIGIIFAVAGSAVGLGNFLRFPGLVAEYGGGAFMIAYFISFLIVGLPLSWAEWSMGRYGGNCGFYAAPGIFNAIWRNRCSKYLGIIAVIVPVVIYMFYVNVEAWCLNYATNYALGNMRFSNPEAVSNHLAGMIGMAADGGALTFDLNHIFIFLLIVFALNFILVYRGISRGIEIFCRFAMPALLLIALVILIRVLTLGAPHPDRPENSVMNGLGYMWNPTRIVVEQRDPETHEWQIVEQLVDPQQIAAKQRSLQLSPNETTRIREQGVWESLLNPQLWLAAAGQIFFSLSVGFGVIINYASYLKNSDDVVLSGLAASSTNEFCEVTLGGIITVPAGVAFLGVTGVAAGFGGSVSMGFIVLPNVFNLMPFGQFFGFLFFFLLFLAAVTSSISMLQPGIAFLEETMRIDRKRSCSILGMITGAGCLFVAYFSKDTVAIDTLDFWVATFLIYVLATLQIILFGWMLGVDQGVRLANQGSILSIPACFKPVMKFICPAFLLTIFISFLIVDVFGLNGEPSSKVQVLITDDNPAARQVAWMTLGFVAILAIFFAILVANVKRYKTFHSSKREDTAIE